MSICQKVQDEILRIIERAEPKLGDAEFRSHLESCEVCRAEAPKIAAEWVSINLALMPQPTPEFGAPIDIEVMKLFKR